MPPAQGTGAPVIAAATRIAWTHGDQVNWQLCDSRRADGASAKPELASHRSRHLVGTVDTYARWEHLHVCHVMRGLRKAATAPTWGKRATLL